MEAPPSLAIFPPLAVAVSVVPLAAVVVKVANAEVEPVPESELQPERISKRKGRKYIFFIGLNLGFGL
jgi:hypothetical protein